VVRPPNLHRICLIRLSSKNRISGLNGLQQALACRIWSCSLCEPAHAFLLPQQNPQSAGRFPSGTRLNATIQKFPKDQEVRFAKLAFMRMRELTMCEQRW